MKEQDLINEIRNYLNSIKGLFCWKEHGGQFGTAGIPDLIVCYKGKFIAFECKQIGRKPTVLQAITIRKILNANGIAVVVTDIKQVKDIIESLNKLY